MTDISPTDTAFSAVAAALAPLPPGEAAALLVYMLAVITTKYNPGVPAAGLKAKLADMISVAMDGQAEIDKSFDASKGAG